jgi:transcriptional regulator with XRE-family HTH domain
MNQIFFIMIGKNLNVIRRVWGYSQQEMAELLKVSRAMYQTYENETRTADPNFYIDLIDYTGISLKKLQKGEVLTNEVPVKPLRVHGTETDGSSIVSEPKTVYNSDVSLGIVSEESVKYGNNIWEAIKDINQKLERMSSSK